MEYGEEKKTYGVLLPVLLVVALLIGYFYLKPGSSRKVSPENGGELVLHTAPLQPQDVTVEKTYIGYVTPINDVDVIPYISGFLEDVYVEGGQEVAAGDTLIVIRQNEYKARMDAAAAQVVKLIAEGAGNVEIQTVLHRFRKEIGTPAVPFHHKGGQLQPEMDVLPDETVPCLPVGGGRESPVPKHGSHRPVYGHGGHGKTPAGQGVKPAVHVGKQEADQLFLFFGHLFIMHEGHLLSGE